MFCSGQAKNACSEIAIMSVCDCYLRDNRNLFPELASWKNLFRKGQLSKYGCLSVHPKDAYIVYCELHKRVRSAEAQNSIVRVLN